MDQQLSILNKNTENQNSNTTTDTKTNISETFQTPAADSDDDKLLWAFAVDATRPVKASRGRAKRAAKPTYNLHRYYVTACSPRLREFGVRAGMRYDQAKALVPSMRVFVYNR